MQRSLAVRATWLALTVAVCTSDASAQDVTPAIVFGARHAVALSANGDVLTWGENVMCQLGRPAGNSRATAGLALRNGIHVAAAADHTLAVTADGRVYGWGANPEGALGTGNTNDQCEGPALIASLAGRRIVQVATGHGFSVALDADGNLYCSGDNSMGQCPVAKGGRIESFAPVPIPALAGVVVAVRAGGFHTLALTRSGTLYAFGRGRDGQLGNGKTVNGSGAVADLAGVVSFAAGTWHSAAALADGSVWLWGNNGRSQLCDGTTVNRALPARVAFGPGEVTVSQVAAGSHATLMRTGDGDLYACGDNQFGVLGRGNPPALARPVRLQGGIRSAAIGVGGLAAAVSPDGCALQMSGGDSTLGGSGSGASFAPRSGISLCGTRAAGPLPDLLRVPPSGGESGCWASRTEEDGAADPRFAGLRRAMLAAEALLKANAAFAAPPVPVRWRTSMSAGPGPDGGARLHVKTVPERKDDGTRLWSRGCEVIPQLDRIGGAISQVSVFFNPDVRGTFLGDAGTPPKLTGTVAGFPEYSGWVLITRDGRLPWIPQTLDDRLQREGARRRAALAEWETSQARMKMPDAAAVQKTYDLLRQTDPAGAEKYRTTMARQAEELERQRREVFPATRAGLEQQVAEYERYRAAFTPEQLRAPAVWGDSSGEGRRRLDAEVAAVRDLTTDEQRQADEWTREARSLERQAQTETKNGNGAEAARLRARANELGLEVRRLRQTRLEKAGPAIAALMGAYDLTNLQPGPAERAIAFKPDPAFPDTGDPNRLQVIGITFSVDPNARQAERRLWQQRVKDTFDYAALAALLK